MWSLRRVLQKGNHFLRLVEDAYRVDILSGNKTGGCQCFAHPLEKAMPEGFSDQDDGTRQQLMSLDEGQDVEQFIQRADAAWHCHERV